VKSFIMLGFNKEALRKFFLGFGISAQKCAVE